MGQMIDQCEFCTLLILPESSVEPSNIDSTLTKLTITINSAVYKPTTSTLRESQSSTDISCGTLQSLINHQLVHTTHSGFDPNVDDRIVLDYNLNQELRAYFPLHLSIHSFVHSIHPTTSVLPLLSSLYLQSIILSVSSLSMSTPPPLHSFPLPPHTPLSLSFLSILFKSIIFYYGVAQNSSPLFLRYIHPFLHTSLLFHPLLHLPLTSSTPHPSLHSLPSSTSLHSHFPCCTPLCTPSLVHSLPSLHASALLPLLHATLHSLPLLHLCTPSLAPRLSALLPSLHLSALAFLAPRLSALASLAPCLSALRFPCCTPLCTRFPLHASLHSFPRSTPLCTPFLAPPLCTPSLAPPLCTRFPCCTPLCTRFPPPRHSASFPRSTPLTPSLAPHLSALAFPRSMPLCTRFPRSTPLCTRFPRSTPLCTRFPRSTPLCTRFPRSTPLLASLAPRLSALASLAPCLSALLPLLHATLHSLSSLHASLHSASLASRHSALASLAARLSALLSSLHASLHLPYLPQPKRILTSHSQLGDPVASDVRLFET
ncbi:hypothetical protein BLNAU_20248 [Blattamonas nauphoetae]|uniref:Uncharacterized protein n=1 Tax=Blattamonas nauphoetae TaxID=2049346 RepID=A0ABQ9WZB7_9EUKA|nr:hypothetical protein BLNAU_20248 [Blattamonas nauphoetae]